MSKRTIMLLVSTLTMPLSAILFAQESTVDREVIVMFQPGVLQLPDGPWRLHRPWHLNRGARLGAVRLIDNRPLQVTTPSEKLGLPIK